eukprot:TRINITY_DN33093_c0_g1_i1.p1 TRINITY_DN33093_c0_g1~~TRINITY_DN33093_c0_g1_i1.p1  ORF type:complete len:156 (-),score=35.95 TRINITY_DN33093_c0_g1_i1:208-675(-)
MVSGFRVFFFSSRRRHTRCREVSWARRCVQETVINVFDSIKMLLNYLLIVLVIPYYKKRVKCQVPVCLLKKYLIVEESYPLLIYISPQIDESNIQEEELLPNDNSQFLSENSDISQISIELQEFSRLRRRRATFHLHCSEVEFSFEETRDSSLVT